MGLDVVQSHLEQQKSKGKRDNPAIAGRGSGRGRGQRGEGRPRLSLGWHLWREDWEASSAA